MSSKERIELQIDILSKGKHRAQALATLTPLELMEEIVAEFHEDEGFLHLNQGVEHLELLLDEGGTPKSLAGQKKSLRELLGSRGSYSLRLQEKPIAPPAGTQAVRQSAYLSEVESGHMYKLAWDPAIIGRLDKNQPYNERVAVNLEAHPQGRRVSRRHAQISVENGGYQLEVLAQNPICLLRGDQEAQLLEKGQTVSLQNEDLILLERSGIKLELLLLS